MIAVINVEITAANPSMPLFPWRAYINSPSSLRIRNVPRRVGNWNIDKVYVTAAYPDNSIKSANCVLVGGIWVCTIAGSTSTGFSQNGYTVFADGKDENGNEVTGYCLGKGDITILEADGTITPGETTYYVHMLSAEPTAPKDGDLWNDDGTWYIYQDGTSYPIGDDSGLIQQLSARVDGVETALSSKADKSQLASYELKAHMQNDVSNIVTARETTDWNYPEQIGDYWYAQDYEWLNEHGDHSKLYYILRTEWGATGEDEWLVVMERYEWTDWAESWQPIMPLEDVVSAPEDTLSLACNFTTEDQEHLAVVLTRENVNVLGLAMMTDLETKQDKLSDHQIQAIDSVVDERQTVITFDDNTTSSYNWVGTINRQTIIDAGIGHYDGAMFIYDKNPVDVKIGTTVTALTDAIFSQCQTLENIEIPDSVTEIGLNAFFNCIELTSVTIGNGVTSIGSQAFFNCESLTSVTIPDSVTSIGDNAFYDCSGLTSVTILDNGLHNLKTIGASAFQSCSGLIHITLPEGIESIGGDAFAGTISYFKLYLKEAAPGLVPYMSNYPWGVSNTANIITVRNATKEWVEEQAYGKGFLWRAAGVNARKKCDIQPFYVNALTLSAARATFEITMTLPATTARESYFALTLGNFTQPMTWSASFDVFEGGSAEAIAPKPNTTNIYHIFEYASGHFMVSKFGSAYDELGNIETLINAI